MSALAGVIERALIDSHLRKPRQEVHEFVATAVIAHLASDAVVERARAAHCRAGCPDAVETMPCATECKCDGGFMEDQTTQMRAALRAAGGGGE